MSIEQEQPGIKEVEKDYGAYVPFKLPTMGSPFNIGEVMSIRQMNERNEARLKEEPTEA